MLACTGYIVNCLGIHFPGMLSHDVSFEELSAMKPFDAWAAVPAAGQAQIIGTIFLAEIITEAKKPHYLMGGEFPRIVFPPIDLAAKDPAALLGQQNRELNNGRLVRCSSCCLASVSGANWTPHTFSFHYPTGHDWHDGLYC